MRFFRSRFLTILLICVSSDSLLYSVSRPSTPSSTREHARLQTHSWGSLEALAHLAEQFRWSCCSHSNCLVLERFQRCRFPRLVLQNSLGALCSGAAALHIIRSPIRGGYESDLEAAPELASITDGGKDAPAGGAHLHVTGEKPLRGRNKANSEVDARKSIGPPNVQRKMDPFEATLVQKFLKRLRKRLLVPDREGPDKQPQHVHHVPNERDARCTNFARPAIFVFS